jgi:hypothetical protein
MTMENELYRRTVSLVASFIGEDKAKRAVSRQLQKANATAETLTTAELKGVLEYLIGATTLYLHPDKARQEQLAASLKGLV